MASLTNVKAVDVVHLLNFSAAYLWNPPYDSWVTRLASTFFVLSLCFLSPVIFLLALDFTSYVIVRTLGIENAHPVSQGPAQKIAATSITITEPTSPPPSRKPTMTITIPDSTSLHPRKFDQTGPTDRIDHTDHFDHGVFATPGSANLELAGVGLFSPPESRTPSPPITRRSTRVSMSSIADSPISPLQPMQPWQAPSTEDEDDGSVLLRRRKPAKSSVGS